MDSRNFYYLQRVLESDLDEVEADVAAALKHARVDLGVFGVHSGGTVTQNAPPDLHVLVTGPALATDPDGERVAWATTQTVDCSQDHLGNSTTVVGGGNERWLSVIAEFDQTYADLVTDGNGTPVYTRVYDSYAIYVTMEAEAVIPTAARPALPTDGVLLADVYLVNGTVQILNADIFTNRRQDYVRVAGTTIPDFVYGTPQTAIAALAAYVDGLSVGTGVGFTATQNWADASTIAATDVSAAINEVISDLAATAGAGRLGAAAYATAGGFCDIVNGDIQGTFEDIADAVDGHIGGGAPAHADTAITSAAQAGSPESFAGGAVRGFLTGLLGHVNDRTERATAETVSANWTFTGAPAIASGRPITTRARQQYNARFANSPWAKTLLGGAVHPSLGAEHIAAGLFPTGGSLAHPWSIATTVGAGYNVIDMCTYVTGGVRKTLFLVDKAAPGVYPVGATNIGIYADWPYYWAGKATIDFSAVANGLPAAAGIWRPLSCCSDGTYVYVLFEDYNGGASTHRVQAFDIEAGTKHASWPANGTALPGTGTPGANYLHAPRIKVASLNVTTGLAEKLATLNAWVNGTVAGASTCVSILSGADGTLDASGCGDMPVSGANTIRPQQALTSDGVYVYFGHYNQTTGGGGMATCQISDPTLGKPAGTWPRTQLGTFPVDAIFDGYFLWTTQNGGAGWKLFCYDFDADDRVEQVIDVASTTVALGHIVFDGLNVWVQTLRDMDGGGTSNIQTFVRIPAHAGVIDSSWTAPDAEARSAAVPVQPYTEKATTTADHMGRCAFDGDGIVVTLEGFAGGDPGEGLIRYIGQAALR